MSSGKCGHRQARVCPRQSRSLCAARYGMDAARYGCERDGQSSGAPTGCTRESKAWRGRARDNG
eukprot:4974611-Alexandrium_andersonii.AAC.1